MSVNPPINPATEPSAETCGFPGGVFFEALKPLPGQFQRHVELTLGLLYETRTMLNWWLPPRVKPVPRPSEGANDICTVVLRTSPQHPNQGTLWVFAGNSLQMSSVLENNPHFNMLAHLGCKRLKPQPDAQGNILIGMWCNLRSIAATPNPVSASFGPCSRRQAGRCRNNGDGLRVVDAKELRFYPNHINPSDLSELNDREDL